MSKIAAHVTNCYVKFFVLMYTYLAITANIKDSQN